MPARSARLTCATPHTAIAETRASQRSFGRIAAPHAMTCHPAAIASGQPGHYTPRQTFPRMSNTNAAMTRAETATPRPTALASSAVVVVIGTGPPDRIDKV